MDLSKIGKQYNVSIEILQKMIDAGVLEGIEDDVVGDYGDKAIERLESCICLQSLGLDVQAVMQYLLLESAQEDTRDARIEILQYHRNNNLKRIHQTKKTMDCIDYIIKELKTYINH